jgi:H+-transporting ATPase
MAPAKDVSLPTSHTSDEVRRRLGKFGPNAMPDTSLHPLRRALTKFWGAGTMDARSGDRP